ncbi:MAG: hypothetical protein AAGU11_09115 [Syntrophobacteraceae bacterium]
MAGELIISKEFGIFIKVCIRVAKTFVALLEKMLRGEDPTP